MPKLIALSRFNYKNNPIEAGDEFDAEQNDVMLLTLAKNPRARVSINSRAMTTDSMPSEAFEVQQPERKVNSGGHRRYNRRDMRERD